MENNKSWKGCGETGNLVHCWWEWYSFCVVWQFFKNLKIKSPYDPAIPLLGIHPKELEAGTQTGYLYTHVHRIIIHKSQKVETTQAFTDR